MLNKIDFNKVLEDMLVKSMTNKDNKELYIEVITLETLAKLIHNDSEKASVVWNAIHRAEQWLYQQQSENEYKEMLIEADILHNLFNTSCPVCSYEYANGYKICPNCGHEMNKVGA